jgi:hypothetical protein
MRRAVFLDRDGVLNRAYLRQGKPYPPATLSELRVLPGVREACRRLHEAGFALILITNQPDIARGSVSAEQVGEIHSRLQRFLEFIEEDAQIAMPLAQSRGQGGFAATLDGGKEFLLLDLHMPLDAAPERDKGRRGGVPPRRGGMSRRRIESLLQAPVIAAKGFANVSHDRTEASSDLRRLD